MLVVYSRLPLNLSAQSGSVASCVMLVKSPALSDSVMLDDTDADVGYLDDANIEFGKSIKKVAHLGQLPEQRNVRASNSMKFGCRSVHYCYNTSTECLEIFRHITHGATICT